MLKCDWCRIREATHDVSNDVDDEGASVCEVCKPKAYLSLDEMYGPGVGHIKKMKVKRI